jgi:hypothetical protein
MPEPTSEKHLTRLRCNRLPGKTAINRTHGSVGKLIARTERAAVEAREFNKTILPDHQEQFYLAGMNAIAEKFWNLARNKHSDPQELRTYADLLHDHFEQKIKVAKNSIALRHLKLLEAKSKSLEELAKDRGLTDMQFFGKIREVFFPPNGNHNGQPKTAKLLENGFSS